MKRNSGSSERSFPFLRMNEAEDEPRPRGWTEIRAPYYSVVGRRYLQGAGVTNAFVTHALPLIERDALNLNIYVITSSELFDLLPVDERERIFPEAHQQEAMGITDFTQATMIRWVRSDYGRAHTLHPFRHGHFLGSGSGAMVMKEAGLDGVSQFEAIRAYVRGR